MNCRISRRNPLNIFFIYSLICLIIVLVIIVMPAGATEVGGIISSNTIWDTNQSPYVVTNILVVDTNVLLEIKPGVEVRTYSNAYIIAYGAIYALGTETNPIVFSGYPASTFGGGICFMGGTNNSYLCATGVFEHCTFSFLTSVLYDSITYTGAIYGICSDLTVSDCAFSNIQSKAVQGEDSRVAISRCTMQNTQEAARFVRCAGVISSNRIWAMPSGYDAVDMNYTWTGPGDATVLIEGNEMWNGMDDGIDLGTCPAILRRNIIRDITDKGISLGETSDALIENNLIIGCHEGISVRDGSNPLIINNTITSCYIGVRTKDMGTGCMSNSIILNCAISIKKDSLASFSVGYCVVQGTSVWPGDHNMKSDPLLTPSYRLKSGSPCIDAGVYSVGLSPDLDGEQRWDHPQYSNIISEVDIGMDEFVDQDLDQMADFWEDTNLGGTNANSTADDDGDELTALGEYNRGTDPGDRDTDSDQLPDGWEVLYSLNPLLADSASADTDTDAMSVLAEYIADTNPTNANSLLRFTGISVETGGVRVSWQGGINARQILHCRSDMTSTSVTWTAILTNEPPTLVTTNILYPNGTNEIRFYRLTAERP